MKPGYIVISNYHLNSSSQLIMKLLLLVVILFAALHAATALRDCDNPEAWRACVNTTDTCHCYKDANQKSKNNTIQKAIAQVYSDDNVNGNYLNAFSYFANDIVTRVPPFGIVFSGVQANVAYLFLGDWTVTDNYRLLNITTIDEAQDKFKLHQTQVVWFKNMQNGFEFPATQNILFTFNKKNLIEEIVIYPDTLRIVSNLPGFSSLNSTQFCQRILGTCVGPNVQYTNMSDCLTYFTALPLGNELAPSTGCSQVCRIFHSTLALTFPDIHCPHTGKLGGNIFAYPCQCF